MGHSAPYGGYVALHAGVALACVLAIVAGAAWAQGGERSLSGSSLVIGLGVFLVALVQSVIGWLQFLELHLSFPWIALQGFGGRAYGNLRQYNLFALLMLLGLLALAVLINSATAQVNKFTEIPKLHKRRPDWFLVGIYAFALLLTGTLVASISRFGMLMCALFVVLAMADFKTQHTRRAWFFLSIPFMYWAWYEIFTHLDHLDLLPYYGTQRAISVEALSAGRNSDRLEIWNASIQLIKAHPWWGLGYGQLPHYSSVEILNWNFYLILDYAHNFFLQWALDFGLPVAGLLLLVLMWMGWQLRQWLKDSTGRILLAMLAFPVVHELVEFPLHYPTFLMPWCVLLGLMLAWRQAPNVPEQGEESLPRAARLNSIRGMNVLAATLATLLGVMSIYSIYDSGKPAQLFQPQANIAQLEPIRLAYTTLGFEHIADYAAIQSVPPTRENAAQLHKLAAKVSKLRFDINVALIYMQSGALAGKMCVAKSMVYRLANADEKSKKNLMDTLGKRTEPEFRALETFARQPYFIEWQPDRSGDC
ncbi:MAG: hypothetical protein HC858_06140 [Brachymonas sp.]|nr:hypothetical protein [Brachymonas sp.]